MSNTLICDRCKKEVGKDLMFDWSICQACYDKQKAVEAQPESVEYNRCGKPHNNADDERSCIECQVLKNNL